MGDERLDGYNSTRNFLICNARVRTMIGSRLDGWSRIGNFLLWWTRVRTTAVRCPDGDIWITTLALRRRASRRLINLPFLGTWKEIWNWSSTERRPDVLLKHPDGCKLDRTFSTQWRVQTERHVVRKDDAWSVWSPNSMARRPDGWNSDRWSSGRLTGNFKFFWLAGISE
jgi:hypothetical protein